MAALACELNLDLCHFDIEQALLQSDLEEDVYMRLPQGRGRLSGKMVRLNKSLYGLNQASRQWHAHLTKCLSERSEFLIDTSQKKSLCVCARVILVKEGSLKRYCYRCVCTTRSMYLVSCEKHSMVVYIHEPYPWAQSVVAR